MKYKYDTSTRAKHNTLQATVKEKHTEDKRDLIQDNELGM